MILSTRVSVCGSPMITVRLDISEVQKVNKSQFPISVEDSSVLALVALRQYSHGGGAHLHRSKSCLSHCSSDSSGISSHVAPVLSEELRVVK